MMRRNVSLPSLGFKRNLRGLTEETDPKTMNILVPGSKNLFQTQNNAGESLNKIIRDFFDKKEGIFRQAQPKRNKTPKETGSIFKTRASLVTEESIPKETRNFAEVSKFSLKNSFVSPESLSRKKSQDQMVASQLSRFSLKSFEDYNLAIRNLDGKFSSKEKLAVTQSNAHFEEIDYSLPQLNISDASPLLSLDKSTLFLVVKTTLKKFPMTVLIDSRETELTTFASRWVPRPVSMNAELKFFSKEFKVSFEEDSQLNSLYMTILAKKPSQMKVKVSFAGSLKPKTKKKTKKADKTSQILASSISAYLKRYQQTFLTKEQLMERTQKASVPSRNDIVLRNIKEQKSFLQKKTRQISESVKP